MKENKKTGFRKLALKSFSVLSASLAALIPNQNQASNLKPDNTNDNLLNHKNIQKRILKPKLVLKLNTKNPENSLLSMHASHSSHASHNSHSSHMSSSPSYTPSNVPAYTPTTPNSSTTNSTPKTPTAYLLGSRLLYKGCEGTDVQEVQTMLLNLGYDISVTGYYDDRTVEIVTKYQRDKGLYPDGKVGNNTLGSLKSK